MANKYHTPVVFELVLPHLYRTFVPPGRAKVIGDGVLDKKLGRKTIPVQTCV